jgi:hypothetical protein
MLSGASRSGSLKASRVPIAIREAIAYRSP